MSTDLLPAEAAPDTLLGQAWRLADPVALRDEPFGALAYHFGNRRLSFLKSRRLVAVVRSLGDQPDVGSALRAAGVPDGEWSRYLQALRTLAAADTIRPVAAAGSALRAATAPLLSYLGDGAGATLQSSRAVVAASSDLVTKFESGLQAPICLTWELTYACNLTCAHCLSSSGRRDPDELTTAECEAVIDELQRMQVFYVNIGGGEPTVRPDFWHLVEYAVAHDVGVKFSTNGIRITPERARWLARSDYVDVQISLDGATADVNDAIRGPGSYATAMRALRNLSDAGFDDAKLSVVVTRQNVTQLDQFKAIADAHGATLRLTRLRPAGRGADVWDELHPLPEQQRILYDWLVANGENVLTGDSFFHLSAFGSALPGLGMCGAGRVVCLIDPVGDVYACPFAIHDNFLAGNLLRNGGFGEVWRTSPLFADLRGPQPAGACQKCAFFDSCRGGCMAAKHFTGLPLDGPDPECVQGHGAPALAQPRNVPTPSVDHTRPVADRARPVLLQLGRRADIAAPPVPGCAEDPLAGFRPD